MISMTVPVSTKVTAELHEENVVQKEMGFYVPSEFQESAPSPKADQEVKLVTRPEMVAYVREFGGYAKDQDWQEQKEKLKTDLEHRQGFDAPYKFWGRKNEVFFVKKSGENTE